MTKIKYLVVHCADTPDGREVTAEEIHRWHKRRGWNGIGYHAVIRRDGTVEQGRPLYWEGAHVRGHNHDAIGVCLVGRDHYTEEQMDALHDLLMTWTTIFPNAQVVGHRDLDPLKTCPNFDVRSWWEGGYA